MKTRLTQRCWHVVAIGIITLTWLWAGNAFGQSSANYQIARSVLDAGGGDRNSATYATCDSLGQVSGADVSTSGNYRHIPGFYECHMTGGTPSQPTPTPPTPPAVPEPGTLLLFGSGLVGLAMLMRRRLKHR